MVLEKINGKEIREKHDINNAWGHEEKGGFLFPA